eukprot:15478822-Alexandrium_andersonii.AAC.1
MEGITTTQGDERMERYAKISAHEVEERVMKEARRNAPQEGTVAEQALPPVTPEDRPDAAATAGIPQQGSPRGSVLGIKRNVVDENRPPPKQPWKAEPQ